jgi:hypothetical protein
LAVEKGREGGGAAGRGEDRAAAAGRLGSEEKKKKGKWKGRLTGGPRCQRSRRKRKRRGGEVGRRGVMADGPLGRLGGKVSREWFCFFLSLFQTSFSNHFLFKFKSNFFSRIL